MSSSFQVGGTTVTFVLVDRDDFQDTGGAGQDLRLLALLSSVSDYDTLAGLITRQINVKYPPSATSPVIDWGFGAGPGSLTIDNISDSPYTAALRDLTRPSQLPDGKVQATCTFLKG